MYTADMYVPRVLCGSTILTLPGAEYPPLIASTPFISGVRCLLPRV